ncbi:MAG: four helix bundle protein [Saprospiraceae bacterium]|nr:four helix bundle protein [Saprospiraceae bacterium]
MARSRFEDLIVWQEAMSLAELVFEEFAECRQYSLKKQIERAVISISTNIAEGFEQGTSKNFVRYLYISKGSCGEVRSLVRLALRLSLISENSAEKLVKKCIFLSVSIHKLISSKYGN